MVKPTAGLAWAPTLLLALLATAAGCRQADPLYCMSNNDCKAKGGTTTMCDIAGRWGPAHTCIAPQVDASADGPDIDAPPADPAVDAPSDKPVEGAAEAPDDAPDDGPAPDAADDLTPDGPDEPAADAVVDPVVDAPECVMSSDCTAAAGKPICSAGSCAACTASAQCAARNATGTAKTCDVGTGQCQECLASADCVYDPAKPICTAPACRACASDAECGGGKVCDEITGRCIGDTDAIHVAATGTGGPCGDLAGDPGDGVKPYCTLDRALNDTTARVFVFAAAATYTENPLRDAGSTPVRRVFVARGGQVVLKPADGTAATILVGGKMDLALEGFKIVGMTPAGDGGIGDADGGVVDGDGIRCEGTSLSRGKITLYDVEIRGVAGQGVDVSKCGLTINRGRIVEAALAGVQIDTGDYSIVDTLVAKCGGDGIKLLGAAAPAIHLLASDTLADNAGAGVSCAFAAAVENTICWGNGSGFGGACSFASTDMQGSAPAGTGNYSADPGFADPLIDNYHLKCSSPCNGKGVTASAPAKDGDDKARPNPTPPGPCGPTGADTGAFEYYP